MRYSYTMLGIRKKTVLLVIYVAILVLTTYGHLTHHERRLLLEANNSKDHETSNGDDTEKLKTDKSENPQNCQELPEVSVVGVKKCGTGALIEVVRMHPCIVAPPYGKTETGAANGERAGLLQGAEEENKFLFFTHTQWPEPNASLQS